MGKADHPILTKVRFRQHKVIYLENFGVVHNLRYALFSIFDHPPTYSYVLAMISLMNYHSKVFNSYIFADHQPTSSV